MTVLIWLSCVLVGLVLLGCLIGFTFWLIIDRIGVEDPNHEYSRLDRLDGLGRSITPISTDNN